MIEQNDIIRQYPFLFENCFDFSVGKGWFPIVERLCNFIGRYEPNTKIRQVKEKFGILRFYVDGGTEDLHKLIELAEIESSKTCEICGSMEEIETKKNNDSSWIRTLCPTCRG